MKKSAKRQLSKQSQHRLKPAYAAMLLAFAMETAQANPMDATVVSGQASFATSGNTLTVVNTPGTIINWQSFSIGQSEITHFAQQSASSAVLNRVIGSDPSNILGTLQSNGRVFLINTNGIVFGAGSTVNVAGLIASTLNLSDADFLAGRYNFTEVPGAQNISNAGIITAQGDGLNGGQIYLIAPNVENSGVITAPNGEILLAAGASVELLNSNDPNLRVSITASAGDVTNVGQLVASAGSLGLFGAVVRNSGEVSADSATMQGGKIVFRASDLVEAGGTISASGAGGGEINMLADMQGGTVNVTGTLDASAPVSGDGGFVDTSAAHVQVADSARVTTAAANGSDGNWLIDPTDFYVSAIDPLNGSSWMSNTTLSTNLGFGNVTIQTLATGTGNGDIFVNDAVSWSNGSRLTLNAIRNVNINAGISAGGFLGAGSIYIRADLNGTGVGTVNFGAGGAMAAQGGSVAVLPGSITILYNPLSYTSPTDYSVYVSGIANLSSVMLVNNVTQLQAINTNLGALYALGRDIDAAGGSALNGGTGFMPIGDANINFTGKLDGLGHTISNLTINRPALNNVGLFGVIGASGAVANVGLVGSWIKGNTAVGGLAGANFGYIYNTHVSGGTVNGVNNVGGLVGLNQGGDGGPGGVGVISSSVSGVGGTSAVIANSYVSGGTVTGTGNNVGGLVGQNIAGNGGSGGATSASASVAAGAGGAGGAATISSSYVTGGTVTGSGGNIGGLVGNNETGIAGANGIGLVFGLGGAGGVGGIETSYVENANVTALGTMFGPTHLGGLVGHNTGAITGSYVGGGSVKAMQTDGSGGVGGLAGYNSGSISNTYVTSGVVDGNGVWNIGGLVGINDVGGTIDTSYAASTVTSAWGHSGVAGQNNGAVSNSFWNTDLAGLSGIGFGSGTATNVVGLITSQMLNSINFFGLDFVNIWYISEGNTRPFLRSEWSTNIVNAHQLQLIAMNLGASYTLGANIDMAETATGNGMWGSTGFTPLGGNPAWPYFGIAFSGQLDGMGYSINNLTIKRPSASNVGLFGGLGWNSVVNDVRLIGGNVSGLTNVGALTGYSEGIISNSYVSGMNVSGAGSNIGGMVGLNGWGTISGSYVSGGSILGGWAVGGLVGVNWGNIDSSHVYGGIGSEISGTGAVGGLAGWNQGSISGSYVSAGNVSGSSSVGGLVGRDTSFPTISNSYVNSGTVVTGGTFVGGLLGWDGGEGVITGNSVTDTKVKGDSFVGGLIGQYSLATWTSAAGYTDDNHVINSFVSGGTVVGGLMGANDGLLMNSSVTGGSVSGTSEVGGLVGANTGNIINSHYNINSVLINGVKQVTAYGLYNDVKNIAGIGQYDDWFDGGAMTLLNITDYAMLPGSAGSHTINSVQGMKALLGFADDATYRFTLAAAIDFAALPGYYIPYLAARFDGADFTISNLSLDQSFNNDLGLFGHIAMGNTVSNVKLLNASVAGGNNVGALAGVNEGSIVNSSSTGGTVIGTGSNVGGLLGQNVAGVGVSVGYGGTVAGANGNAATVSDSYVSGGSVSGAANVGGLVGQNLGGMAGRGADNYSGIGGGGGAGGAATITRSFVSGVAVNGSINVGGLVGQNLAGNGGNAGYTYIGIGGAGGAGGVASVSNSYVSDTTVGGNSNVGGMVGSNESGIAGLPGAVWGAGGVAGAAGAAGVSSINTGYASGGSVTGSANVGGIVGYNSGTVTKTFWDTAMVAGNLTSGIGYEQTTLLPGNVGAVGATLAEMMSLANFSGWNISGTGGAGTIWRIYEGNTTPLLSSFLTPLSVNANTTTLTYGQTYTAVTTFTPSTVDPALLLGSLGGTAQSAINVGTYSIDASGFYSSQLGYDITYTNGNLIITPATLTVTADNLSKVISSTDPLLTYTVYGLQYSDTAAGVFSGMLARILGEGVGTYQINQGTLTLTSGNYTMIFVPGTFTIVAPTVINEIVKTANQGITEMPLPKDLILADVGTNGDPNAQSLPMCY